MLKRKKYLFLLGGFILIISTMVIFVSVKKESSISIIEKTLGLKLSASVKIENFTYYEDGGYYNVKILIEEKNLSDLKNQLNDIFYNRVIAKQNYDRIIILNKECSWWDLKEENVIVAYNAFFSSIKKWFRLSPESHDVWAFIVKQKDEKYYLYISY